MTPVSEPSYLLFGNLLTFRERPSAGAPLLLTECRTAPGAGAPPNRHPGDDEAFHILSGRYAFVVDGVERLVGPGDYVRIPNGAPHHFRNPGPEVASTLILNWPGRMHEAFFSSVGEAVPAETVPVAPPGPPPEAVLSAIRQQAAACGVELLV
jgi:mannose-6-phosphate isomerase-like protein (cupin superfamily)